VTVPSFIYVGTGKAGSTWLHQVFQKHPGIFVTPVKETNFFDLNYRRGFSWYEEFFRGAKQGQAVGEISHRYMRDPEVSSKIRKDLGEIKIMAFFREPCDYFLSDYLFTVRNGGFSGTVEEWADNGFDWDSILYAEHIRPYFDRFPVGNIMIAGFQEIGCTPSDLLNKISSFLCIGEFPEDAVYLKKVNAAKSSRNKFISRLVSSTSKALKKRGGQRLIARLKYSKFVQAILYKKLDDKPEISLDLRHRVIKHSIGGVRWLDSTFDSRFEESWY
jgi:hypothetical protein